MHITASIVATALLAGTHAAHAQCGDVLFQDVLPTGRDLTIDGDVLYTLTDGLKLYNVADPASPVHLATFETTDPHPVEIAVRDGLAYIAQQGFSIVDVSDPIAPVELAYLDNDELDKPNWISIALNGNIAYLGDVSSGVTVVDVTDPTDPQILDVVDFNEPDQGGTATDLHVQGDRLYVAGGNDWHIGDISNPTAPVKFGRHPTHMTKFEVAGNTVYTIDDESSTLSVFDATDPKNIQLIGSWVDPPPVLDNFDIVVNDGVAFIAAEGHLRLIDVTDPTAPELICELPGMAGDKLAMDGNLAFVADYYMRIVDLADVTPCYADFNADGGLNMLDFVTFQIAFVAGDLAADCDSSLELNVLDFVCFQQRFAIGCP